MKHIMVGKQDAVYQPKSVQEMYNRGVQRFCCQTSQIFNETSKLAVNAVNDAAYLLMLINLTSKTKVLLAGSPGMALLPYASLGGIVSLRSPPAAIPTIPISHP